MGTGNTFGRLLKTTLFGESHGLAIGGVIDGFPAGFAPDFEFVKQMLQQRSPSSDFETARKENDDFEILSGLHNGKTLGSPIAFIFRNNNTRSSDYDNISDKFRPGHADYVYFEKYGIKPQKGGGRASGRETVSRVFAGALAADYLRRKNIEIISSVSAIGNIKSAKNTLIDKKTINKSVLRCSDVKKEKEMLELLKNIKSENDSIGGEITSIIKNMPTGIGEPIFSKINSYISEAILSIPGTRGIEFGEGFSGITLKGSEYNDSFCNTSNGIKTNTNHSGGIQGGISNGNDIIVNTIFRPASSIGKLQQTTDIFGNNCEIEINGRHDVCFVPRAVPVVSAMIALSIMDLLLISNSYRTK